MGGSRQALPKNWPEGFPYLTSPGYSPSLTKAQLLSCRKKPPNTDKELREIPRDLKLGPCPLVKVTPINDPCHPACGQSGLFAARSLPPGSLILPYLGEYHPADSAAHAFSDYDLWLDRDAGVAVDAARMGNEARFVNDYRGVPSAVKPNAEFCEVWDLRRGEKGMAVFVLPVGKKAKGKGSGIAKGEEILISYGKGFWDERKGEVHGGENEVGGLS
ncbi:putative set domain-containing protein [Diaporthe ampelina]|uniref:Putative set domain-containing protein n=1 Tax=Diaporthe ampelina TaxID=1214573 RepID=A0A0G2HEM3_9PEZI|nr:putative set domain-containing protein [Diaporthe ampelina]